MTAEWKKKQLLEIHENQFKEKRMIRLCPNHPFFYYQLKGKFIPMLKLPLPESGKPCLASLPSVWSMPRKKLNQLGRKLSSHPMLVP